MKMARINKRTWAMGCCASAALAACGGGGIGSSGTGILGSTSVDAVVQVATFIDAPVAGLEYTSTSTSGVTDPLGNFEFVPGEVVTFSVGNVTVGSIAPTADVVRPLDLVPGATSALDTRVTRILQTLQSMDDNDDLTDGIQISRGTREHLRTATSTRVHLDDDSTSDDEVERLLPTGSYTVTKEDARLHYEDHENDDSNAQFGFTSTTPASTTPATVTQPANTAGRLLASNCFQCHGTGGSGGFERIRGGEASEVYDYFYGREGTAGQSIMTAHAQGFTKAQLDAIVSYLNQ